MKPTRPTRPTRTARAVLSAFIVLMAAVMAQTTTAGAETPTADSDQTIIIDGQEAVADDSPAAVAAELGLTVPEDDGLDLSEQELADLDLGLINRLRNQPEALQASKKGLDRPGEGLLAQSTNCSPNCAGLDPVGAGCDDGAVLREYVDTIEETRFYVQLRFSSKCGSIWSRAVYIDGNVGRVMALETREYRTETTGRRDPARESNRKLVSGHTNGWGWTTMLNAPGWPNVRACSTSSTDFADNYLQCSRPGYTSLISDRGLCLDVPYRNFAQGQRVWIYDCHGYANLAQMWQIRPDGSIQVGDVYGNMKCLRIDRGRGGNAVPLVLWDCQGYGSQQWQYKPNGQIVNTSNGTRCVDVPNGTSARMTYVQVWQCMIYTSNKQPIGAQKWRSPQTAYLDGLN